MAGSSTRNMAALVATSIRRQSDAIIQAGLADDAAVVERRARVLDRNHRDPNAAEDCCDAGAHADFTVEARRRTDFNNLISAILSLGGAGPALED